ncbi:DoxX family protein [Undibacterium sp.]|jgi:putative oxidoreductase|uniref:DoxX family protein n=1 Tax=Undibacterium sp. TaxID=1914977 RepID=UPI002C5DB719|nr:DoxX family protein [Undibacterium sp.]HTD06702.1 DoxX family protein [Undibacterium sp.]
MDNNTKLAYLASRALIGALFFISGLGKVFAFSYVAGWMASSGVPLASVLLAITIIIEVGGGLMLITGLQARWSALAIALFTIPVTIVFHAFWSADAANFQNQLTQFLKNLAIFGGLILVFQREKSQVSA